MYVWDTISKGLLRQASQAVEVTHSVSCISLWML